MDERPASTPEEPSAPAEPPSPPPATSTWATSAPPPPPATPAWATSTPDAAPRPLGLDRGPLVAGVVLIVVGLAFLLGRVVTVELGVELWPLWIVAPGLAMLIGSLLIPERGGVGLAIPGAIVTMVGLVLWFQETTDAYETWAYAWALVAPGGVGLGMLVFGLLRGYPDIRDNGLRTLFVGIALFLGFAFFFEGVIGLSGNRIANLDTILPVAIVVLGVIVLVLGLVPRRSGATR